MRRKREVYLVEASANNLMIYIGINDVNISSLGSFFGLVCFIPPSQSCSQTCKNAPSSPLFQNLFHLYIIEIPCDYGEVFEFVFYSNE